MATTTTRLLGTAISPEYIKSWDIPMAIRELLQNLLDTKREFGVSGAARYNKNRCLAELKDDGPGLELKHLALGISEKGADSVGQFGEGLKLALLLFARENRFIEVRSRDFRLTPLIKDSEFGTQTLFFQVEDMAPVAGTTVRFQCSQEELNEGKSYFPTEFRVQGAKGLNWVMPNKISLPGGNIYVNGSLVAHIEDALFSYHLWGEKAKAISNRDRTIVERSALIEQTREVIHDDENPPVKWFEAIFRALRDKEQVWEFQLHPVIGCKELGKALKKIFGDNVAASEGYSHEDQLAKRLGYNPVALPGWNWHYVVASSGIPLVGTIIKDKPVSRLARIIPSEELVGYEQDNLSKAYDMVDKYYYHPGEVLVVEELNSVMSSYKSSQVLGCYCKDEDVIYLVRDALGDIKDTVNVLLHETVHKKSKAPDLSESFQAAQDELARNLLLELGGRA